MNCETVLKNSLNRLTGAEKAVADYILAHPQEVVTLSVQALAAKSKSSGSAVMRLVKKLGFDSYPRAQACARENGSCSRKLSTAT